MSVHLWIRRISPSVKLTNFSWTGNKLCWFCAIHTSLFILWQFENLNFIRICSCSIEKGTRKKYTSISCAFVLIIIVIWAKALDPKLIVICWCSCSMWNGFGTQTILLLGMLFESTIIYKENMDAVKSTLVSLWT